MRRTLVLAVVAGLLLGLVGSGAPAQIPVIPFKVIRTVPHMNNYSAGLAWEKDTIWVGYSFSATLEKFDPYTGTRIKTMTSPNSSVRGLAFDGIDVWVATWTSSPPSKIYTMDPVTATVQRTFTAPFTTGASDGLAYDGAFLWVTDENDRIYQIDPLKWSIVNTVNVPSTSSYNPRGLAWDTRVNAIWAGYQSNALIRKHNPATGAVIEEFTSPYTWSQQGLAWDGYFLWATGGQQSSLLDISQIDVKPPFMVLNGALKSGTPIRFQLTGATGEAGNLFVVGWSGSGASGFNVCGKTIHLTFDSYTVLGLALLPFFSGTIDSFGTAATPAFTWPAVPSGIPFWVCAVTLDKSCVVSVNEPIKYVTQ